MSKLASRRHVINSGITQVELLTSTQARGQMMTHSAVRRTVTLSHLGITSKSLWAMLQSHSCRSPFGSSSVT
jgi:hypothetical protein